MRTSSLIGHVVEVLDNIRGGRQPADTVVREFFRSRHYLGSSDRRYIAERTFDILRQHALLTCLCREALAGLGAAEPPPSVPSIMLVAAHEVRGAAGTGMGLEPDIGGVWRVYVPDVECAAFLEAVGSAEIPEELRSDIARFLALQHSIPEFVVRDWLAMYGRDETDALCAASNGNPPVTIRVNTLKGSVAECLRTLELEGIAAQRTQISPVGLILPKRINAQGLHSFRQGWFEMQDEGSQLLSMLPGVRAGMTVLDACAGAGGKSLHLAALMRNRGKIVALDVDPKKLENFTLRTRRAGVTIASTAVVAGEEPPPEIDGLCADAVLVDAPCSGTGTFRRNPGAKLRCTAEFSAGLARTQSALLARYAKSVKPGGCLVYSTCTLVQRENQDVVEGFLSACRAFTLVPAAEVLARQSIRCGTAGPYLELLPHRTGTDGYFAAVMVKAS